MPDRLTEVKAWAQLKNCLKDGGFSLHFLCDGRLKVKSNTGAHTPLL